MLAGVQKAVKRQSAPSRIAPAATQDSSVMTTFLHKNARMYIHRCFLQNMSRKYSSWNGAEVTIVSDDNESTIVQIVDTKQNIIVARDKVVEVLVSA